MFVKPEIQGVVAEKLALLAKSPVDEVRNAATQALRSWATTKEVPTLIDLGNGANGFELAELLTTLARFKDERTIPLAIQGMKDSASRVFCPRKFLYWPKSSRSCSPCSRTRTISPSPRNARPSETSTPFLGRACVAAGPDAILRLNANVDWRDPERQKR